MFTVVRRTGSEVLKQMLCIAWRKLGYYMVGHIYMYPLDCWQRQVTTHSSVALPLFLDRQCCLYGVQVNTPVNSFLQRAATL